jgi:hypothetical protein
MRQEQMEPLKATRLTHDISVHAIRRGVLQIDDVSFSEQDVHLDATERELG